MEKRAETDRMLGLGGQYQHCRCFISVSDNPISVRMQTPLNIHRPHRHAVTIIEPVSRQRVLHWPPPLLGANRRGISMLPGADYTVTASSRGQHLQ